MNKFTKTFLIAGGICLSAGIIVTGIALGMARKSGMADQGSYEKISTTITDNFENIHIEEISHDIKFVISDDDSVKVEYWDNESLIHDLKVEDDTLTLTYKNSKHWWDWINIGIPGITEPVNNTPHDTIIYLPEDEYKDLKISGVSSDVIIPEGFIFEDISIDTVSGEITCQSEAVGNVKVETTSGNLNEISINGISATVNTVSGDVHISNSDLSGSLVINTTSGEVALTDINISAVAINTTSGDINLVNYSSDNTSIDTTSGDIDAIVIGDYNIAFDSVSGDQNISCNNISDGARFTVNTVSGDLTVRAA